MKRLIALLLAAAVTMSCFPLSVLADPETTPAPDIPAGTETPLTPVNHEGDSDIPDTSTDGTGTGETTEATVIEETEESTEAPTATADPSTDTTENTDASSQDSSTNAPDVPAEDALQYQEARSRLDSGDAAMEDAELLLTKKQFWPQSGTEDYDIFFQQILAFFQTQLEAAQETESLQELSYTLNLVETMLRMVPADVERTEFDSYLEQLHLFIDSMNVAAALEELAQMNVTPARYLSWSKAERQAYDNRQAEIRQMLEPVKDYLAAILPPDEPSHSLLELLEPVDVDNLLYTFQINTGTEHPADSWQITATVKGADQQIKTLWMYPGTNPHCTELKDVLLNEDFSLGTAAEPSQLLCFNGSGFLTSTSISDCISLVLFRNEADPNGNPSYLDGMTQLQVGQMPTTNERLFIGLIVPTQDGAAEPHGKLYLMDPASDSGFVFVKDVVLLDRPGEAATVDNSPPQHPDYAPGIPTGSQEINIVIGNGAASGKEIEESVLIFSSLNADNKKEFTKEIYADASTHSEEEGTDAQASEDEPDPASETPGKLATVTFQSAEVMRYNNGYSPSTTDSLARCAFQFEPRTDGSDKKSYFIYATDSEGKYQYLKISRNDDVKESGHVLSNSSSNCDPIFIENNNGMFQFYTLSADGTHQYLYFIPSWRVFTHEAYRPHVNTDVDPNFILYRQCEEAFYPISSMDEIADNGKYLIIPARGSATNAANLLLYPATATEHSGDNPSARNAVLAGFSTSLSSYTSTVRFHSTEHAGNGTLFGGYYKLKQTSLYDPENLNHLIYPEGDSSTLKTAVMLGGSVDVLDGRGSISESDITYDPDSCTGEVRWEILDRLQNDTFAQLGTTQDYNGDLIPLKDCLYTFTADSGSFRISHKMNEQTTVYLDLSTHGIVNKVYSDANQAPTFTIADNGSASAAHFVKIQQNASDVGALYFWGWGIFTHTLSESLTNTRDGVSRILLYRPVKDDEKSSDELYGYVNVSVSDIKDGEQYLIAVVYIYNNQTEMYFVHPSTNGTSTNAHVAKRTTQAITGSTKIRFYAERIHAGKIWGQAILKLKLGEQEIEAGYQIDILPEDTMSTATQVQEKLVIGTGTGIGGYINSLVISTGTSFQLNPAVGHQVQLWLSSNNDLVSVDQTGKLTIHDPEMTSQEPPDVTIYVLMEDNQFYTFPVTVLKNTYTRTRIWNYYIADIVDTDVYMSYPDYNVVEYDDHNFMPVQQYQVNYLLRDVDKAWGTHFFAKPKDNYALYYMDAPGSSGIYKKLDNKENPKQTEYYISGPCGSQANIYGEAVITNMLQHAMAKGCVGAMGFTGFKGDSQNKAVSLAFRSAKLASFKKSVAFVFNDADMTTFTQYLRGNQWGHLQSPDELNLPQELMACRYQPGMNITSGSKIVYVLEIDHEDWTGGIQYTHVRLDDELSGVTFIENEGKADGTKNILELTPGDDGVIDLPTRSFYYAAYTYNGEDPINTAKMTYSYKSMYQTGEDIQLEISASAALTKSIQNAVQFTSLTVGQNLSVNFYIGNSALFDSWKDGKHHLHFDFQAEDGALYSRDFPILTDTNARVTTTASVEVSCQQYSLPVPAQYMATPIHMHVENENHVPVSDDWVFTVQAYVKNTLEDLQSPNSRLATSWQVNGESFYFAYTRKDQLTHLLKDLLNFGAYTQRYLGHTTGLANEILYAEEQKVNFGDISLVSKKWFGKTESDPEIRFTGVALETGGQSLGMRVYFQSSRALNLSMVQATVQHISSEPSDLVLLENQEARIQSDPSMPFLYYVSIRNIPVNQLSCIYRVQIQREDGDEQKTSLITLNALTYVYLMTTSAASFDESLKNLAAAIYNYNNSALAYFHPEATAKYAIG